MKNINKQQLDARGGFVYDKGHVIKSVSIWIENMELIAHNDIKNLSLFINELISDSLTDNKHLKRLMVKRMSGMQIEAKKLGFDLEYNLKIGEKK